MPLPNAIELIEHQIYKHKIDLSHIDFDYFTTQYKNNFTYLKAKQFVGVAQFKDLRISVYPKLYYSKDKAHANDTNKIDLEAKTESMNNFLFMLTYIYNIDNIKNFDSFSSYIRNYDFLEIIIYLFSSELLKILQYNLNHNYVTIEKDSHYLKGTWKITQQLSKSPHQKHKFSIRYDNYTANNLLNQIFKFTCQLLLKYSKNLKNISLLRNINLIFTEVDNISKPNLSTINKVKFMRQNIEFNNLFQLAKMFILNLQSSHNNSQMNNFTFLFDMNLLFEQFIANFIRREIRFENEIIMQTQESNGTYLCKANKSFILKPDISFWNKDNCKLILDTKYKIIDETNNRISSADAYQMYAYAMKYNCEKVILLYPNIYSNKFREYSFDTNRIFEGHTINLKRNLRTEKENLIDELKGIIFTSLNS